MMIQGNDLIKKKFQEIFLVHGFFQKGQEIFSPWESN
jgi:hypothetical protein